MLRVVLGAVAAAFAMFLVGFIFHATPLSGLGTGSVGNTEAAQMQAALAANLRSTGTYAVPNPSTPEQTVMVGQGPVATIHYSATGYAAGIGTMFMSGMVLNFLAALGMGLGLLGISRHVHDFTERARIVVPFAAAAAFFIHIGRAVYLHHDWMNAIYSLIGDGLSLAAGGLVVAWFMPATKPEPVRQAVLTRIDKPDPDTR